MQAGEWGGGLAKCLCYYMSLCSKLANGGGGGQKLAKSCLRSTVRWYSFFAAIIVTKAAASVGRGHHPRVLYGQLLSDFRWDLIAKYVRILFFLVKWHLV